MASLTIICPNKARCVIKVTPSTSLNEVMEEACKKQGFDADTHALKHQNRLLDLSLSFRLSGLTNNASVELVPAPAKGAAVVEIALQMSDGSRRLRKFPIETTLLEMLVAFSEEFQQNLLDTEPNTAPSCGYMNKQWTGKSELETMTLKSLGITQGRSLIRYSARKITDEEMAELDRRLLEERQRQERLDAVYERKRQENEQRDRLEQQREEEHKREIAEAEERRAELFASRLQEEESAAAMDTSEEPKESNKRGEEGGGEGSSRLSRLQSLLNQVTNSIESNTADFLPDNFLTNRGTIDLSAFQRDSPHAAPSDSYPPSEFANFKFPDKVESSDAPDKKNEKLRVIPSCDRQAVVFIPCEREQRNEAAAANSDEVPDEFFDVTTNDLRTMQRSLAEEIKTMSQRAFVPKSFVEAKDAERKRTAWKHTVVRFLLPDKRTMQACFLSLEPGELSSRLGFAREIPPSRKRGYPVSVPPNVRVANEEKTLIEAALAPTVTLVVKLQTDRTLDDDFLSDNVSKVDASQAEVVGKEWLGANERFVPYRPSVPEELLTAANASRRMDYGSEDASSSGNRSSAPKLPRWMQKK
uniref:TUG ubiquitin-like domain-containing protein n=1 Tax=Plectus sambesii TaxID=2011161 RepID=A0A914UZK4_9BILA